MSETRNEQEEQRRIKLAEIRAMGVEPYPPTFGKTHDAHAILDGFSPDAAADYATVAVAGRIMALRRMGKATFCHIQDQSGRIQIYFKRDDVGEQAYDVLKKLDLGDIIGAEGYVFSTQTGETTVYARSFT
ncbi:MAG: OB-fold nucleic acid binding domain-containing protein, partial [Candidatus Kapaibacteriota bacterium]